MLGEEEAPYLYHLYTDIVFSHMCPNPTHLLDMVIIMSGRR